MSFKTMASLVLVEKCSHERKASANTEYDHKRSNDINDHILLVRLAGLTVIFRAARIAFHKIE